MGLREATRDNLEARIQAAVEAGCALTSAVGSARNLLERVEVRDQTSDDLDELKGRLWCNLASTDLREKLNTAEALCVSLEKLNEGRSLLESVLRCEAATKQIQLLLEAEWHEHYYTYDTYTMDQLIVQAEEAKVNGSKLRDAKERLCAVRHRDDAERELRRAMRGLISNIDRAALEEALASARQARAHIDLIDEAEAKIQTLKSREGTAQQAVSTADQLEDVINKARADFSQLDIHTLHDALEAAQLTTTQLVELEVGAEERKRLEQLIEVGSELWRKGSGRADAEKHLREAMQGLRKHLNVEDIRRHLEVARDREAGIGLLEQAELLIEKLEERNQVQTRAIDAGHALSAVLGKRIVAHGLQEVLAEARDALRRALEIDLSEHETIKQQTVDSAGKLLQDARDRDDLEDSLQRLVGLSLEDIDRGQLEAELEQAKVFNAEKNEYVRINHQLIAGGQDKLESLNVRDEHIKKLRELLASAEDTEESIWIKRMEEILRKTSCMKLPQDLVRKAQRNLGKAKDRAKAKNDEEKRHREQEQRNRERASNGTPPPPTQPPRATTPPPHRAKDPGSSSSATGTPHPGAPADWKHTMAFIEAQTDRRWNLYNRGDFRMKPAAWEYCIREVFKAFPPRTMAEDAIERMLASLDTIEPLSNKILFTLKKALVIPYHPDKNRKEDDEEWASLAEHVTKVGNTLLDKYTPKVRAANR